jgi:hypothetical protein
VGTGTRRWRAPGSGSWMVGGGGDMVVSRAIAERERVRGKKFAKCGERERGPEILV